MKKVFTVEKDFFKSRLDRWFKKNVFDAPQAFIEKKLRQKKILVNNKKVKSSYKLEENDLINITNIEFKVDKNKKIKSIYKPSKKEVSYSSNMIIEDNENFVVLNKPSGISVQSGTKSKRNVIDLLRSTKEFLNSAPFTVHRIDKETSGICMDI